MFSENNAYVKMEDNTESTNITPTSDITVSYEEPSIEETMVTPNTPLIEESTEKQPDSFADIKEPEETLKEEQPPTSVETKQAEPITPIPNSAAETRANKCIMGCTLM